MPYYDDILLETTGKKTEKTAKAWNQVQQRRVLGYSILARLYFDGKSVILVVFSPVCEKAKKSRQAFWNV